MTSSGPTCGTTSTPAGNGSFSQNVQRLGLYAMDSWRAMSHLTINYGLRWDTTFGLFNSSGVSQNDNAAVLTRARLATAAAHLRRASRLPPRLRARDSASPTRRATSRTW